MIMMGKHLLQKPPFDTVFIHGLVRDEHGKKMSKSAGNVVDPLGLIDKYGADALRFALTQPITHGQDLTYSEDRIIGARNFCNKLWNASRFVMMNLEDDAEPVAITGVDLTLADRWILSRHTEMLQTVTEELECYNLAQSADALYEHVWSEFCDWYLELAKPDLYGDTAPDRKAVVQSILRYLLSNILRALHPFLPFVTEAIWQIFAPNDGAIMVQPYPEVASSLYDKAAEGQMRIMQAVVSAIRNLRAVFNVPPSQKVSVTLQAEDEIGQILEDQRSGVISLASLQELHIQGLGKAAPAQTLGDVAEGVKVFLHVAGTVDIVGELKRLETEINKIEKLKRQSERKLASEGFVSKAPQDVVQRERQRLDEATATLQKVQEQADLMRGLLDR